jgi:hypothetical protein
MFDGLKRVGTNLNFALASKGKRFLMIKPPTIVQRSGDQVTVVLNWFDELRRRAPTTK